MRPYKVIEDGATHITYEYRTAYTWTLYAALLVTFAGMVIPNDLLAIVGSAAIVAYFVAKLSLDRAVMGKIRAAMKSNAVQISGNKASFSSPLRIRVPK
jgi:hypothetical protein